MVNITIAVKCYSGQISRQNRMMPNKRSQTKTSILHRTKGRCCCILHTQTPPGPWSEQQGLGLMSPSLSLDFSKTKTTHPKNPFFLALISIHWFWPPPGRYCIGSLCTSSAPSTSFYFSLFYVINYIAGIDITGTQYAITFKSYTRGYRLW